MNGWLLSLLNFLFLVAILPVKSPCTLTVISRGAPLLLIFVAINGGCCRIFGIWDDRLSSHPFWKLIYGLLGCVTTITIWLLPAVFLYMALFTTLVTSYIWPGRWPSSRATTISTVSALVIDLLQNLFGRLFNGHSVCLREWRLIIIFFFACSRFPPLWIHKIAVLSCSFLYKGLIGYDILLW